MKWFTADTHFNHKGIIEYNDRPFKNVWSMNDYLIERWNERVQPGDIVYHLGDFAWGVGKGYGTTGIEEIISKLKGQIILIEGSHDKPCLKLRHRFAKIIPMMRLTERWCGERYDITLCHYSMRVWPRSHFNSWHLFGHSHGRLAPVGKSWDVGVDNAKKTSIIKEYTPFSLDDIIKIMADRPDNLNFRKEARNDRQAA